MAGFIYRLIASYKHTLLFTQSLVTHRSKSLSVPRWITRQHQGIEYKFISQPDEDLLCQKCNEIVNEPHQMKCCSSLFCKSCISDSEFQNGCCKEPGRSTPDGRSKKRIQQMIVICPNATRGIECNWEGELYRCYISAKKYDEEHQKSHQDLILEAFIKMQEHT